MNGLRGPGAALLLLVVLGLAGCSGGGEAESLDAGAAGEPAAAGRDAAARSATDADGAVDGAVASQAGGSTQDVTAPRTAAIISTGSLTVRSDDVGRARFELGKVVDSYGGQIADEKTTAGTDGEVRLSRLVLRIPSEDFDEAMTDLGRLGDVTSSTRKAEDVTTQVIDTEVRIRAQEASLERVELLLARAQSIRDIVAIEAQLTRRQAELDSLKGQLAWLQDQTTLATITVYLERAPEPAAARPEEEHTAFVAGLLAGWDALTAAGAGLAKVAGALLPFAAVGLLVVLPAWLLMRRWLAAHPLRRPAAEGVGEG